MALFGVTAFVGGRTHTQVLSSLETLKGSEAISGTTHRPLNCSSGTADHATEPSQINLLHFQML